MWGPLLNPITRIQTMVFHLNKQAYLVLVDLLSILATFYFFAPLGRNLSCNVIL